MNLDLVIAHLRQHAPVFVGRVAGAADFAQAVEDQAWMACPAAYVIPLDEDASDNEFGPGLQQQVVERIGVVVEFDNAADRRGQASSAQYGAMRAVLWAALLNWQPDPENAPQGLFYAGGRLLTFDRARLFYQWEFASRLTITEQNDGWQEPAEPLLQVDVRRPPSGPGMHVVLPQT